MTDKKAEKNNVQDLPASQIDLVSGGAGEIGEIQNSYVVICPEDTKGG